MIVDSHVHLWRLARGDNDALSPAMAAIYRDLEPPDLKPRLDAAGIGRAVVVQAAETLAETLFIIGLARKFPWIAGIVAWLDPASPSVEEEAAALAWNPIVKGVRPVRNDNASIAWMLGPELEQGWRAVRRNGLTLDILVQDWTELPLAAELARRLSGQPIILDHCGKPDIAGRKFDPWADHIAELSDIPHTACKLSGLMNCAAPGATAADVRPYADHVLACFGASRVMWASDWPPLDLASDYATWKRISDDLLSGCDSAERHDIFAGTAIRVYQLKED